jgi:hypothetical protein
MSRRDGASLWWPNKDHMICMIINGMTISVCSRRPMAVANGKLTATKKRIMAQLNIDGQYEAAHRKTA